MCRCDDSGGIEIPLILTAQAAGSYKVTSPVLPELVAYGDTPDDALNNARDALGAILDLYEEQGRPLPPY